MERSALITGAGSGIGRGLALALARRGYRLLLVGRDEFKLQAVSREVDPFSSASLYSTDLCDPNARFRLIENLLAKESNPPSLIVHNAALMPVGNFLQIPVTAIQSTLTVNLLAPVELTRHMCAESSAPEGVIFILSTAGRFPQPFNSLYSASKAGLRFLAESLQVEWAGKTRVCLAYPPLTETPMTARFSAHKADPLGVAEKIVRAYESGQDEITWLDWEVLPVTFYRLLPRLFRHLLKSRRQWLARLFDFE